jgi:hypothetical protein
MSPDWLLRDGKHPRTDGSGRTNGGTDWMEREYNRADKTVIDARLAAIAKEFQLLERLQALGVGVRVDSGL